MAKSQQKGMFASIFDLARYVLEDEIKTTLQDIINALGIQSKDGMKPVICHHHKIETGWHVVINIPIGLCSDDILHWLQYFEEQLGAYIEAKVIDNKVHLDIHQTDLPDGENLPFEFDPTKYITKRDKVVIPIGKAHFGFVTCDISRLPHLFIAGESGSGKTTEIINIIFALLMQGAELHLVDLKQVDYGFLRGKIPMVEEEAKIGPFLKSLECVRKERAAKLVKAKVRHWRDYPFDDMPYKVLVLDETAEIIDSKIQDMCISHARLDRCVGISIIGACQRPSSDTWNSNKFRQFISLFDAKLCYRVIDTYNSAIVLGKGNEKAYTHIAPEQPGRGIWKYDKECIVQSMYIRDPYSLIETISIPNNMKVVEEIESEPKRNKSTQKDRFTP